MASNASLRSTAAHRALSLPEIVENIISHLPLRNIIANANRVSAQWHNIISTSPNIQRRLKYKRSGYVTAKPQEATSDKTHDVRLSTYSEVRLNTTVMNEWNGFRSGRSPYTYNVARGIYVSGSTGASAFQINREVKRNESSPEDLLSSDNASWQRMYITEPPITTLLMTHDACEAFKDGSSPVWFREPATSESVFDQDGITFDKLEETCMQFIAKSPNCQIAAREGAVRIDVFLFEFMALQGASVCDGGI